MLDSWFFIAIAGIAALLMLGRRVAFMLMQQEQQSPWFAEHVGTEYTMDFPDKERESYDQLQEKIRQKHDSEKTDPEWYKKCTDAEVNVLLLALKNVLVKSISNLAQLQKDRPGCYRLWRGKLISESYWESLQQCEEEVKEDISSTLKEANSLRPGVGDRFFDDCLNVYRRSKDEERKEEHKQQLIEMRKQEEIEKKKQAEKSVVEAKKQEKEREKMMQALILEEERELAKKSKKRNVRSKKG